MGNDNDLIKNIIMLLEDAVDEMKSRKDKRIVKNILEYIERNVEMVKE